MKKAWIYALLVVLLIVGGVYIFNPFATSTINTNRSCTQCGEDGWATGPISSCYESGTASCEPIFEGQTCKVVIEENQGGTYEYVMTNGNWECTTNPYGYKKVDVYLMKCKECTIEETTTTIPASEECPEGWVLISSCEYPHPILGETTASCPSGKKCKVVIEENQGGTYEYIVNGYTYYWCTGNEFGYGKVDVYQCGGPPTTTPTTISGECKEEKLSSCDTTGTATCPTGITCFISIEDNVVNADDIIIDTQTTEIITTGPWTLECSDNPAGHQRITIWSMCDENPPCIKADEEGCSLFGTQCCDSFADCLNGICIDWGADCTKTKVENVKHAYGLGFNLEKHNSDLLCCLELGGKWYDIEDSLIGSGQEAIYNEELCESQGYYTAHRALIGDVLHTCNYDTSKNYAYCSLGFTFEDDWVLWIIVIVMIIAFIIISLRVKR